MRSAGKGSKRLAILGTLDTRGDEVAFLKELIEAQGHRAIVVDMGVMGTPHGLADYSRERVAEAGGDSLERLKEAAEAGAARAEATEVMIAGARQIVSDLVAAGELDGVMGLGGSTAAASGAAVMGGLPIGFPKLLLTTFIKLAPVGEADMVVMQSPVDLVGMNSIVAQTLSNAAGALMGMAEQSAPATYNKPLVGITALGVTTPAVQKVIAKLESMDYDAVVFHALTDKLDQLISGGAIDAVIDLTAFEMLIKVCYSDEQIRASSGCDEVNRTRLAAAEQRKIPHLIAPGGLDVHILPGVDSVEKLPAPFKERPHAMHGPDIMLVRSSAEEMQMVGQSIAEKLNGTDAPMALVIPQAGFSDASREGSPMHDASADQAFVNAVHKHAKPGANIFEFNAHINDDQFAERVIEAFQNLIERDPS